MDEVEEEKKWSDQTALWQAKWHLQNWLDCIRTRKKPVADVEIGHRSITVCHLVNITRRVGRPLKWDPAKETFWATKRPTSWSNDRGGRGMNCRPSRSGKSATVFNVCGNKHRMATAIHYNTGKVFVLELMSHAEYSKNQWKDRL